MPTGYVFIDMKIKKFLEKVADEDREALIDEKDIEFLASIGVDYNKKREADKKKPSASYYLTAPAFNYKAFLISASCFILLAISVFLIVFYSLKPFEPPVGFMDIVEDKADSNLQELNEDLNLFSLSVDEYECSVTKYFNKNNNESLYYSLECNGLMKSFKFDIVVNSRYEHNKISYTEELEEVRISEYTLKYNEVIEPISDTPFNEISCKGEIQIGEQFIYIVNYSETHMQSTFVETLKSIINFN